MTDEKTIAEEVQSDYKPTPEEAVLFEWLKPIQDPELFLSLVDLGLIYEISLKDRKAHIKMTLTSPGCPVGPELVSEVQKRALEHENVDDVSIEIVWEPKWDPRKMASEECREALGLW